MLPFHCNQKQFFSFYFDDNFVDYRESLPSLLHSMKMFDNKSSCKHRKKFSSRVWFIPAMNFPFKPHQINYEQIAKFPQALSLLLWNFSLSLSTTSSSLSSQTNLNSNITVMKSKINLIRMKIFIFLSCMSNSERIFVARILLKSNKATIETRWRKI